MMHTYSQKILVVLLALVLAVGGISLAAQPVSAAEGNITVDYYGRSALADLPNAQALLYAYDQLAAGVEAAVETITIYDGTHPISKEEVAVVMDAYRRDYAHHFWLGNNYQMSLDNTTIHTVKLEYLMTGTKLEKARADFEKAAQKLIDGAQKLSSDYDKELYLHDQLAAKITYVDGANAHNAYGALVEGKAVCEGYAEALQYLLQRCGIQSFIATGSSVNPSTGSMENHAWNYVRIDGKYYHVDLTWDDQGADLFHVYFNLTDKAIQEGHMIRSAGYALPQCNAENAFYFRGKPENLTSFTVDAVAELLKQNALKAHVYINGDLEGFLEWFSSNIQSIAQKVGITGGFSYGYSCLGRECILTLQGTVHTHSYDQKVSEPQYLATKASCTEAASYYFSCTCGEKGSDTFQSGSAKGHDYAEATCTAPKTCKNCKAVEGEKLGHSFTNYKSNGDATCDKDGTKTAKCDRCSETDTVADSGSAKGHDFTAATCTTAQTCKVCGQVGDAALGHDYGKTWSKGEDGHWYSCNVCGEKSQFAPHDYDSKDQCKVCQYTRAHTHKLTLVEAKEANCLTAGNQAYYTCSGCEDWFADAAGAQLIADKSSVTIAALSHSFTNYVSNGDATCTSDGTKIAKCDRCDVTDVQTEVGSAKGHDYSDLSCTSAKLCKVCGATDGEALGHSFTNYKSNGDATCDKDGTKTAKCDRCDATETVADTGSALGHDYSDLSCTAPKVCKRCGASDGEALGHSFTNYKSNGDATCEKDGTKTAKCDRCDAVDTISDPGSAKGHNFTDATCTEGQVCTVCNAAGEPALGHAYGGVWQVGAEGHWRTCAACAEQTELAAHDYGADAENCLVCGYARSHVHQLTLVAGVDATCTQAGSLPYYTCSGCADRFADEAGQQVITDSQTLVLPMLEHTPGDDWQSDESGHWKNCACGEKLQYAAHEPGPEATEISAQVCTVCGFELAKPLDHVHSLTKVDAQSATCTTAGNREYYTCQCGQWFADAQASTVITDHASVEIPAGHTDGDDDGICDACGHGETKPTEPAQPTQPDSGKEEPKGDTMLLVIVAAVMGVGIIAAAAVIIIKSKKV